MEGSQYQKLLGAGTVAFRTTQERWWIRGELAGSTAPNFCGEKLFASLKSARRYGRGHVARVAAGGDHACC